MRTVGIKKKEVAARAEKTIAKYTPAKKTTKSKTKLEQETPASNSVES